MAREQLPELNETEKNTLEGLINHRIFDPLMDLSEVKEMTPERLALSKAIGLNAMSTAFLPILEKIGVDVSKVSHWSILNYTSSGFSTHDKSTPNVRVLDPADLESYAKICGMIGHPIDVMKIMAHYGEPSEPKPKSPPPRKRGGPRPKKVSDGPAVKRTKKNSKNHCEPSSSSAMDLCEPSTSTAVDPCEPSTSSAVDPIEQFTNGAFDLADYLFNDDDFSASE